MAENHLNTSFEFRSHFPRNESYIDYLAKLRWPNGWVCPRCQAVKARRVRRHRWLCAHCRYETSVTAGTIFQDSHLALETWFRAIWEITVGKEGMSALTLQRRLKLKSNRTAWILLHKLRQAMVPTELDRLSGVVEVDVIHRKREQTPVKGQWIAENVVIAIAAEADRAEAGRVWVQTVPDLTRTSLHVFIAAAVAPGSTVRTDGSHLYQKLRGYTHQCQTYDERNPRQEKLQHVQAIIKELNSWMLRLYPGGVSTKYLNDYLNEFTFHFNPRGDLSKWERFDRLARQAAQIKPTPYARLEKPQPVRTRGVN